MVVRLLVAGGRLEESNLQEQIFGLVPKHGAHTGLRSDPAIGSSAPHDPNAKGETSSGTARLSGMQEWGKCDFETAGTSYRPVQVRLPGRSWKAWSPAQYPEHSLRMPDIPLQKRSSCYLQTGQRSVKAAAHATNDGLSSVTAWWRALGRQQMLEMPMPLTIHRHIAPMPAQVRNVLGMQWQLEVILEMPPDIIIVLPQRNVRAFRVNK